VSVPPRPEPDESVLGAPLEDWIARRAMFWLALAEVVNWREVAVGTGLSHLDRALEDVRSAIQKLLPPGSQSSTVTTGIFAYLVPGTVDGTVDQCRGALRALRETKPNLTIRMGIAPHHGAGPLKAGDLTAHATWALARHAQQTADGLGFWLNAPTRNGEPSA
jgi:hypothetical protein